MDLSNICCEKADFLTDEAQKMALSFLETDGVEVARRYIETCFNVPDLPRPCSKYEETILAFLRDCPASTDLVCQHFKGIIPFSSVQRYLTNLKKERLICLRYNPEFGSPCWHIGDEDLSLPEYCEDLIMDFLQSHGSATSKEIQVVLATSKRATLAAIHSLEKAGIILVCRRGKHLRCSFID